LVDDGRKNHQKKRRKFGRRLFQGEKGGRKKGIPKCSTRGRESRKKNNSERGVGRDPRSLPHDAGKRTI